MREKSIISMDAVSLFLLWLAGSAIPFRLLALLVPTAKINLWYLAIALFLSVLAIAAVSVRYEDGWRFSPNVGQLCNRLSLVVFGAVLGVWGLWLN